MMNMTHPPGDFLRDLMNASHCSDVLDAKSVDDLPMLTGAYALILHLKNPVNVNRPRTARKPFAPGWYVYAGSARGPGGIHARLARHLRTDKPVHWHIDQLTVMSGVHVWASPAPNGHECDLVTKLINSGRFDTACAGFGSSDCRLCEGHLLVWNPDTKP